MGDTVLDTPCFGQCGACGTTTILFQIDMSQEDAINPVGVHMNGNFNGWDGANFLMMDDADGDMVYVRGHRRRCHAGCGYGPVQVCERKRLGLR